MVAIVGYVLGENFSDPAIAEIKVSETENIVYVRQVGSAKFDGLQSMVDLRRNWNALMDAAGLTAEERSQAVELFNAKIRVVPGTQLI